MAKYNFGIIVFDYQIGLVGKIIWIGSMIALIMEMRME